MDTPKPLAEMTDAELQAYVEAALAALNRTARLLDIVTIAALAAAERETEE